MVSVCFVFMIVDIFVLRNRDKIGDNLIINIRKLDIIFRILAIWICEHVQCNMNVAPIVQIQ